MVATRFRIGAALWLVAWALTGCFGGSSPARRHFRLEVPHAAAARDTALLPGTLLVERPRTDALLAERAFVWRPSPESVELRQYAYTSWIDAPASLVQEALVSRFAEVRVADRVVPASLGVPAQWLLLSRIERFERIGGGAPVVEVQLELSWMRTADRGLIHAGRYRVTRRADSEGVEDAAVAFGLALGEVLDLAVADLQGHSSGIAGR
jgi:ABC-type uncharacterized transport system auxiliary subunit